MMTLGRRDVHCVVAIFTLVFAGTSPAFETSTHVRITDAAVSQSVLAKGYLEQELGLALDVVLKSPDSRKFTIRAWPGQGSIHEDDFNVFSLATLRFRPHFYDPVYDRGLTANLG